MGDQAVVSQEGRAKTKELVGIEGWLIFPALYLVIVAFATAEALLESALPASRPELLAGNVAVLVGAVVLLALFFKKLTIVPPLMIVFYVTVVAVCTLEYLTLTRFSEGIPPAVVAAETEPVRHALGHVIGNAILWIPYFVVSERVRNTFVE